MVRAWIGLTLVLFGGVTVAKLPDCLIGFGALSESEAGRDLLISRTYGELLDKIGGTKFTPTILEKLLTGMDPFTLPEQSDVDLQVLQKNLKDFERMLEAKGWKTPETRDLLLADLQRKREGIRRADKVQQRATVQAWGDYDIAMNPARGVEQSPDGRWLVSVGGGNNGRPNVLRIYDVEKKNLTTVDLREGNFGTPGFTPDGKEILMALPHQALMRIPFLNGKPDVASATTINQIRSTYITTGSVHFGADSNLAYTADGLESLTRFNLSTGQSKQIDVKSYLNGEGIGSWGFLPGTDLLYVLRSDSTGRRIEKIRIEEQGTLHKVDDLGFWPKKPLPQDYAPSYAVWTPDGSKAFTYSVGNRSRISAVSVKRAEPTVLWETNPNNPSAFDAKQMAVSRSGDIAALMYTEHNLHKVRFFDPVTHKVLADFRVADEANHIEFSPDGLRFYVHVWTGKIMVINPDHVISTSN